MNMKSNELNMTEGGLSKKILMFSIPVMASSMLQLLFNTADMIVVGKYAGAKALAAVSSTGPLINLLVNLFIGLSVGVNVVVSRNIGANKEEETNKSVHNAISISLISGVALTVFGFFGARSMLELMDSPADVIDLSTIYLKIYFLGSIFSLVYNYGAAILRAKGDAQRPLIFLTIAWIFNIVLKLFLVVFVKLGVIGVAIATVVSQAISSGLVIHCLLNDENESTRLNLRQISISKENVIEIMKVGLPAGIQSCLFAISNAVIQSTVNSFGSIAMAGNGAALNIEGYVYAGMNAFYHSCMTFTGQNYGAKLYDRVLKIFCICQFYVVIVGLTLGVGSYYFGQSLLSFFSNDYLVIESGMIRLTWATKIYFLYGIMEVAVGGLRGLGYSTGPMLVSVCGICALRLLWIAMIFPLEPTLKMLYLSLPISWIVTGIIQIAMYFTIFCRIKTR